MKNTAKLNPARKSILSGTGEWKIEGVPTGAVLTLTEDVEDGKYDTSVESSIAGGTYDPEGKSYALTVEEDTTVTFTNTLKKQYVKFVLLMIPTLPRQWTVPHSTCQEFLTVSMRRAKRVKSGKAGSTQVIIPLLKLFRTGIMNPCINLL